MPGAIYSVEIQNAQVVRKGLEDFTNSIPRIGRSRLLKFAQRVKKRLRYTKTSPPKRGKYVRTFTLLKSYLIERVEQGYVFWADPVGPKGQRYGVYVLGTMLENSQRWVFQGRWPSLRDAVEIEGKDLPEEVRRALGLGELA